MFLRTLLVALLVVVFSATGFVLGRFTAPAPTFEPSSNRTDADVLDAAWNDFIRAQQETLELFRSDEFFSNDQERLPKDVPRFNEAQRRQQIRTRRANVHRRFDG